MLMETGNGAVVLPFQLSVVLMGLPSLLDGKLKAVNRLY